MRRARRGDRACVGREVKLRLKLEVGVELVLGSGRQQLKCPFCANRAQGAIIQIESKKKATKERSAATMGRRQRGCAAWGWGVSCLAVDLRQTILMAATWQPFEAQTHTDTHTHVAEAFFKYSTSTWSWRRNWCESEILFRLNFLSPLRFILFFFLLFMRCVA